MSHLQITVNPPQRSSAEWDALVSEITQRLRAVGPAGATASSDDSPDTIETTMREEAFWRAKAQQGVKYNRAYWNLQQVEPSEVQSAVSGLTPKQAEAALAFFKSVANEPVVRPMMGRLPSGVALDAISPPPNVKARN